MIESRLFRPKSIIKFYTEEGELIARSSSSTNVLDGDVIHVSTANDLETDAATFQLILTSRNDWVKKLASNDLVEISLLREGVDTEQKAKVMVGLVDDVRETSVVSDDSVQRIVTITGRNFAKALINFEVGAVQEVEVSVQSLGWLSGRITFGGQSSANIINNLMSEIVFKYMEYEFSNGKKLSDLLHLDLTNRPGEQLFDEMSVINYQGSVQGFIRDLVDEPFNQIFMEVYDGKATLVTRETPFNENLWNKIPRHTVTDVEVEEREIGRSDLETYSMFSVGLKSYFAAHDVNQTMGIFPLWHEPYFKKHGIKRLQRFTAYAGMMGDDANSATQSDLMKQYQTDLFNWNVMNPIFYNGVLTVTGDSKFKIGDRLLYKSKASKQDIEFFIESVTHDYAFGAHFKTKLEVTRGLEKSGSERFKAPWGQGKKYEGGALGVPAVPESERVGMTPGDGGLWNPDFGSGGGGGAGAQAVVAEARSWLNKSNRYVFGGGRSQSDISRGRFDCSSWIRYVYEKAVGLNLGPLTGTTTDTLAKKGTAVSSESQLQVGDLVFYNTYKYNGHVVIYLGGNKAIGTQSNTGVGEIDMKWWKNKYGLGSMRRVL